MKKKTNEAAWVRRRVVLRLHTSSDCTLCARIVGISREDRDHLHLVLELLIVTVVVDYRLKSSRTSDWF